MDTVRKPVAFLLAVGLILAFVAVAFSRPAAAASVTPKRVAGNTTCAAQGLGNREFKVDSPDLKLGTTTYSINGVDTVTISTTDLKVFNWSSTLRMAGVIVKGGTDSNVYVYNGARSSDTVLNSPISNKVTPQLSHVTFCYYRLNVTKTAQTSFTRTHNWTVDKSVTSGTLDLFKGDSGKVEYTVKADKVGFTDSEHKVSGTIVVTNPAPIDATLTSVKDVISPDINANVTCPSQTVPKNGSLTCTYSASLPDASSRINTATATSTGFASGSGTAPVTFGATPTKVVNDTINVDDDMGTPDNKSDDESFLLSASGSEKYERTFSCDQDKGLTENTATIRQTGQAASASVMVNCYALGVSKTADTSLTRTYTWSIDKFADHSELTLEVGELQPVEYTVKVDATHADSDHAVSGTIEVSNPAPIDATVNSVSDVVSGVTQPANVDCGGSFPRTIPAGGKLTCTYSASLLNNDSRTNTATATLQNKAYDSAGNATNSGTTDFSGTATVDFASANVNHVDEKIDVSDKVGDSSPVALGSATVGVDTLPQIFTYTRNIGPYSAPGNHKVENTASFVTNDTGATGSDSWTVDVNVVQPNAGGQNCTLTIGYWKNHAGLGNGNQKDRLSQYLPIYLGTPGGLKSVEVGSNLQAVELLNKSDDASNGINKLYAQMLGAKLNIANGADPSAVASTIADADVFLASHNAADWNSLSAADKQQVLGWAETFDRYNNGLIGPGHCG